MEIVYSPKQDCFGIRGDTYQYRDILKKYGGLWNSNEKCWFYPNLRQREHVERVVKKCKKHGHK